ncbi:hypothetical protein ACFLYO_04485 [Chloroflexota bacterium]
MNRAVRWLLLVVLITSSLTLVEEITYAQTGSPTGATISVTCNQYLRIEPEEDADHIGLMNPGDVHQVLGRNADWLYIEINPDLKGWTYNGNCVTLNGSLDTLQVVDPTQVYLEQSRRAPSAAVVCNQYLRRYPSTDGFVIRILDVGETLSIGGRNEDNTWMLVTAPDGQTGWTSITECVPVTGNFLGLPIQNPDSEYVGPPVIDVACEQYVRAQPDMEAAQVAVLYPADDLWTINGRDTEGSWLLITNADGGITGWTANSQCTTLLGDFGAIPFVTEEVVTHEGPPMATLVCAQNLRAYPATDGRQLAVMDTTWGTLSMLGRTADNNWLYVQTADGQEGWTSHSECLALRGNFFAAPVREATQHEGPPLASAVCSQYLRTQPDPEAARVAIMNPGEGVYTVVGRNTDGTWLYLSNDSFQGWAGWGECLNVQGNALDLPVHDSSYTGEPVASVVCTQYLRAEPNTESRTLDPMPAGTTLQVLGRNAESNWIYVLKADGSQGWTALGDCISIMGNVASKPILSPGTYDGPTFATVSCSQYLRTFPDNYAEKSFVLNGNEGSLLITGRNANSTWMQVTLENGTVGWAATGICLSVQGDFYTVPIVQVAPPAPYSGPPVARVNCSQFLRVLPQPEAEKIMVLNGTEGVLTITGRSADGNWMQLMLSNGTTGWTATNACLAVAGNLNDAPVVNIASTVYTGPPIGTLVCTQYIREQATTESPRSDLLRPEDGIFTIIGRNENTTWLYVQRSDGLEGWVANGACFVIQGQLGNLPVVTEEIYTGPPVADIVCDANFRRTPTADGTLLSTVRAESGLFNILARDANADWLLLEGSSGMIGWVALSDCLVTQGAVLSAPVTREITDQTLWTVLWAEGACDGSDQASQLIAQYNRTAPAGPVYRVCNSSEQGLQALTQFNAEIAIVDGECPGFQQVPLSGGQTLCYRNLRTTQVDNFMDYARGQ